MPNASLHDIVSASTSPASDANFIASTFSANFSASDGGKLGILHLMSASKFDSKNYGIGASAMLSSHIAISNIVSEHMSDSIVGSDEIGAVAVVNRNLNVKSADNGVRLLQVGSRIPDNGLEAFRLTETLLQSSGGTRTLAMFFKSAQELNHTALTNMTPLAFSPPIVVNTHADSANLAQFVHWRVLAANSGISGLLFGALESHSVTGDADVTVTFHVDVIGSPVD